MSSEHELIEATATVVALEGDMAVLEAKRTSACNDCGAAKGCGISVLVIFLGRKRNLLHIKNDFNAVTGEQVIIGMPESDLVLASLAVYMLPLLAMIGLSLIALALGFGDGVAGLGAMVGLAGGLVFAGHLTRNAGQRFVPVYLRRTPFEFASKACGT
ncbi:MAG: SoxR reducing system RseC family protein [bacterium]|nr:SoxR reducing system RseC family protein [bacterium]